MSHRSLAVAALVAAPILPLTLAGTPANAQEPPGVVTAPKPAPKAKPLRTTTARAKVLARALAAIGRPYVYGAEGPRAFDCSGLTQWALKAAGKRLPRTTWGQAHAGRNVTGHARPGDVLVYPGAGHVALVYRVARGLVIDTVVARRSGTRVTIQKPYVRNYTVRAYLP